MSLLASEKVPAEQVKQSEAPGPAAKEPAAHTVQMPLLLALPGRQSRQAVRALLGPVPGPHTMQESLSALMRVGSETVLGGHGLQAGLPVWLNVPGPHAGQPFCPPPAAPAGQAAHELWLPLEKRPAGQGSQILEASRASPGAHWHGTAGGQLHLLLVPHRQLVRPAEAANPAGQALHAATLFSTLNVAAHRPAENTQALPCAPAAENAPREWNLLELQSTQDREEVPSAKVPSSHC